METEKMIEDTIPPQVRPRNYSEHLSTVIVSSSAIFALIIRFLNYTFGFCIFFDLFIIGVINLDDFQKKLITQYFFKVYDEKVTHQC